MDSFKADAVIVVISEDYYIIVYFLHKILRYLQRCSLKKLFIVHADSGVSSQDSSEISQALGADNVIAINFSRGDD